MAPSDTDGGDLRGGIVNADGEKMPLAPYAVDMARGLLRVCMLPA